MKSYGRLKYSKEIQVKKIIAVIGNANIDSDIEKQKISFELGKLIIDHGYVLATGGLGGVMEYASKGAKHSKNYTQNSIIGVLPDYSSDNANPYVDIPIPTGLGLARNLVLISLANAVIAVGGGSGTLNEISAAWQMGKLIIGLKTQGWSEKLCGQALDDRRQDKIFCAETPQDAINILNENLAIYLNKKFSGVKKARIGAEKAKEILSNYFLLKNNLELLGMGSEGYVFKDAENIYKIIDNEQNYLDLYWKLLALADSIARNKSLNRFFNFTTYILDKEKIIVIKYRYSRTIAFLESPQIEIREYISLLKEFKKINWVLADFQPKNIRIAENKVLIVSDIGHSFYPFSEHLFKSMCRRAFVTYKLQNKLSNYNDFKKYLSPVNTTNDFSLMAEFGFNPDNLKQEFEVFYHKVDTTDKKDLLNPIIKEIFTEHINVNSVLDYGSGYGDMADMLNKLGLSVTAYEPDEKIVVKYKNTYYQDIQCINYLEIQKLIQSNKFFDSVLCSLVLCHLLAETKQERLQIINQIMSDLVSLSNKYIVLIICNPLYTYQTCSVLQKRILPNNFSYQNENKLVKKIYSSARERFDIHRPLSFYETLFAYFKLDIKGIIQTSDSTQTNGINNSDFIVFILEKNE